MNKELSIEWNIAIEKMDKPIQDLPRYVEWLESELLKARKQGQALPLVDVIGRLKSIKRYAESYGEGGWDDDGEFVWYEDLEQVIKDFE